MYLALLLAVIVIFIIVIIAYIWKIRTQPSIVQSIVGLGSQRAIKPRNAIADFGWAGTVPARGWYDVQGQGVANDYCRLVGDGVPWWSCSLAGGSQYTPAGQFKQTDAVFANGPSV